MNNLLGFVLERNNCREYGIIEKQIHHFEKNNVEHFNLNYKSTNLNKKFLVSPILSTQKYFSQKFLLKTYFAIHFCICSHSWQVRRPV